MKAYSSILFILAVLISSCETPQNAMQGAAINGMQSASQRTRNEAERLTNNGRTLPSASELNEVVSNPGDICYECDAAHAAATQRSDPGYQVSLKNYDRPSAGCLPIGRVSVSDSRAAMAELNLTTDGATEAEERTVGAALLWMKHLNGGRPLDAARSRRSSPYPIRIRNGDGYSGQRHDHIIVNRNGGSAHGLSVAQHVHELGHLIGNNGAYTEFRAAMGGSSPSKYCMVSNYADNNANEQFAEVLTAFVTEPSILLNNSRTPNNCRKAFEFFTNWFGAGERARQCM